MTRLPLEGGDAKDDDDSGDENVDTEEEEGEEEAEEEKEEEEEEEEEDGPHFPPARLRRRVLFALMLPCGPKRARAQSV